MKFCFLLLLPVEILVACFYLGQLVFGGYVKFDFLFCLHELGHRLMELER